MPDVILAFILAVLVPARALWRSRRSHDIPRQRRYVSTIVLIALLLIFLGLNWITTGRSLALLGLALPLARLDLVLISAALLIIAALAFAIVMNRGAATADTDPSGLLPTTAHERRLFIGLSFATDRKSVV